MPHRKYSLFGNLSCFAYVNSTGTYEVYHSMQAVYAYALNFELPYFSFPLPHVPFLFYVAYLYSKSVNAKKDARLASSLPGAMVCLFWQNYVIIWLVYRYLGLLRPPSTDILSKKMFRLIPNMLY